MAAPSVSVLIAPAPVVIPRIPIRIGTGSVLSFTKVKFFGKGQLFLQNDFNCDVPEGTNIKIGKNSFCLVDTFKNNLTDLPPIPDNLIKVVLPVGTGVIMECGAPMALSGPLEVELPMNCSIKLLSQTKIQQRDFPVKLVLHANTDAELDQVIEV
ncbi:putative ORFan [Tupanvirus deep ocean]|uniref:ORFan n=2 Tax=Tupanvirus TaxID=2094720 RepID=A0AC62AA08_9VIRU|nr:putative ORFan [Tupanvirus deep ocean]QKU34483.1 putative ORFan [Tupanvirus deep ocean]